MRSMEEQMADIGKDYGVAAVRVMDEKMGEVLKGKKDFDGLIDGGGYKQSFDNPAKPPLDLIAPQLVLGIGRVLGKGAQKYSRGNWMRGMSWCGVLAAILRHTFAIIMGEDRDPETGELHVYHIGCEIMFLAWFQDGPRATEYRRFDDRLYALPDPRSDAS